MKSGKCPKCGNKNITIIKDSFHKSGGGNIPVVTHPFLDRHYAQKTFYICSNCGYIEEYLDELEIRKFEKN